MLPGSAIAMLSLRELEFGRRRAYVRRQTSRKLLAGFRPWTRRSCRSARRRPRGTLPCPIASVMRVRAPYDQCLSSRRFMLRRDVKLPPSMRIECHEADVVRIGARRAHGGGDDLRLFGAGTIDEIHARLRAPAARRRDSSTASLPPARATRRSAARAMAGSAAASCRPRPASSSCRDEPIVCRTRRVPRW